MNTPPPPPPKPAWVEKLKIGLGIVVFLVVVGLIIYGVVKRRKHCKTLEDEANKAGPGKLKCNSGDKGPTNKCGKWICQKSSCPALYTEDPVSGGCKKLIAGPKDPNLPIPHDTYEAT